MAHASTEQASGGGRRDAAGTQGGAVARQGDRPGRLQTERGATMIADVVVTKVVSMAAREIRGVHELGGGTARAVGSMAQRVGIGDQRRQGVLVEVGEREAAIDLTVVVEYGVSIPQVAEQIRDNVIRRVEAITGLNVTEVNVAANDLHFAGDDEQPNEPARVQ